MSWSPSCSNLNLFDIQRMNMPTESLKYVLVTAARWSDAIDISLFETILIWRGKRFCLVFKKKILTEIYHDGGATAKVLWFDISECQSLSLYILIIACSLATIIWDLEKMALKRPNACINWQQLEKKTNGQPLTTSLISLRTFVRGILFLHDVLKIYNFKSAGSWVLGYFAWDSAIGLISELLGKACQATESWLRLGDLLTCKNTFPPRFSFFTSSSLFSTFWKIQGSNWPHQFTCLTT